MPRYVILRHESPSSVHFDFMLESGAALKTWSMSRPPEAGVAVECQALADHRPAYLDYEGAISGGRGVVARWDRGTYSIERQSDAEWIVELAGEKLVGKATIRRVEELNRWRILFQRFARLVVPAT